MCFCEIELGGDPAPITPEQYENLIHPLQCTAERVGREVEMFAEKLESLLPTTKDGSKTRYEKALILVDEYHNIAKSTVERLQKQHGRKMQRLLNSHWRDRVRSEVVGQADWASEMDEDEVDNTEEMSAVSSSDTTVQDLQYWRREQQTWSLLRRLMEFRTRTKWLKQVQVANKQASALEQVHRYASEEKIWQRFLIENRTARERNTILTWLKESAEISGHDMDIIVDQLESASGKGQGLWAHGWLDTKEAIKAQKRLRSWPQTLDPSAPGLTATLLNADKTESLVAQLDPDAVTRQGLTLDHQDQYLERSIWLACWEMVRRGWKWSEIRDWCRDRNEIWRAVSLRGGIPAWDPVIDGSQSLSDGTHGESGEPPVADEKNAPQEIEGNRSRALWRRTCFSLARQGGLDEYERAVYGVLSGDLESVERVCGDWDDFIFAHFNALLLSQFDAYLRNFYPDRVSVTMTRKFGAFDAQHFHGDSSSTAKRLVESLKVHPATSLYAFEPTKQIQGALIAKTFDELVYQHGLTLSKAANINEPSRLMPLLDEARDVDLEMSTTALDDFDHLRMLCHMFLVFKSLDTDSHTRFGDRYVAMENVIVAYIDFLRLSGKITMVPLYASQLTRERQFVTLAVVLRDITSASVRQDLVRLIKGYRIEVPRVIKTQLQYAIEEARLEDVKNEQITIEILEKTATPRPSNPSIKKGFIGADVSQEELSMISSFEWYMHVEGRWHETFTLGASLFKRLFCKFCYLGASKGECDSDIVFVLDAKRLAAARKLAESMPSSQISYAKTEAILGKQMDVTGDALDDTYDQLADMRMEELNEKEAKEQRQLSLRLDREELTPRILATQAKLYTEFESLAWALSELEGWRKLMDAGPE